MLCDPIFFIAKGQGQITPGDKILLVAKRCCYFDRAL